MALKRKEGAYIQLPNGATGTQFSISKTAMVALLQENEYFSRPIFGIFHSSFLRSMTGSLLLEHSFGINEMGRLF